MITWKEFGEMLEYRVSSCGKFQTRLVSGRNSGPSKLGAWKDKKTTFKRSDYTGAGYLVVGLKINGKHGSRYVHRIVAEHFCEKNPGANEVDHLDGDRKNNHYTNLKWVNHSENMKNAVDRGALDGRNEFGGKLSKEKVLAIITMINAGINNRIIADKFSVDKSAISCIKNKRAVYKSLHHLVSPPFIGKGSYSREQATNYPSNPLKIPPTNIAKGE